MSSIPRTRQSNKAHPAPTPSTAQARQQPRTFTFPSKHHLIITTPSSIYAWDVTGIRKIFKSSKGGIVAAKASKDGSQVLAVADKHVVVLHDCKRGRDESWGLSGADNAVRLLEYAPDAQSLYLSTSLTGAIQCYSTHESRLLDPALTHPSPPTVLAISPNAQLMLSASDVPPVVYLQNLTLGTPALQLSPAASDKPVVVASFHPERPNVFLLAFRDGTLAAYDATKMARRNGLRMDVNSSTDGAGKTGEIGRLKCLHRTTNKGAIDPDWSFDSATFGGYDSGTASTAIGSKSVGITAAAFMPGYRSRAVSVGADGRCKLVDFGAGGQVLRTWHAKAPLSSLSVLATGGKEADHTRTGMVDDTRQKAAMGEQSSSNNVITVGSVDGKVLLFDSLGLKLDAVTIEDGRQSVISVEWALGTSPPKVHDERMLPHGSMKPVQMELLSPDQASLVERKDESGATPVITHANLAQHNRELEAARLMPTLNDPLLMTPAVYTNEYGTVIRSPAPAQSAARPWGASASLGNDYLDLFSPVKKQMDLAASQTSPQNKANTIAHPALRPRLSSTTFVRQDESGHDVSPKTTISNSILSSPRRDHEDTSDQTPRPRPVTTKRNPRQFPVAGPSPLTSKTRRNTIMITPGHMISSSSDSQLATTDTSSSISRSGQILAELRRIDAEGRAPRRKRKSSHLAFFAPYMNRTAASDLRRRTQAKAAPEAGREITNRAGLVDARPAARSVDSTVDEVEEGDIWITEPEPEPQLRRRQRPQNQPEQLTREQNVQKQPSNARKSVQFSSPVLPPATNETRAFHPFQSGIPTKSSLSHRYHYHQHPAPPHRPAPAMFSAPLLAAAAATNPRVMHADEHAVQQTTITSSDEGMHTARDYLSPTSADGTFSPTSQDLRDAYPRASSLSPARKHNAVTKKVETRDGKVALRDLPAREVNARVAGEEEAVLGLSGKGNRSEKVLDQRQSDGVGEERSGCASHGSYPKDCDGCMSSRREIEKLKQDVARMKVEMLAMKMAMRRAGVEVRL